MNIAFLFIAEPYQCYHGASVAFETAAIPGVQVSIYYNDPESVHHLERIRKACGFPPIEYLRMRRNLLARAVQAVKILGFAKWSVYPSNEREFSKYDAIFTVEDTAFVLFEGWKERPKKIYMPHGAGDGIVGFSARARQFDFLLFPGPKSVTRMLELGHIRPDNYATIGLVKLETADRLYRAQGPFFKSDRPVVFYNSHKTRGLASWNLFIEPMLADFSASTEYNLIVAPHVKKFRRRSRRLRRWWESRGTDHIIIDTGSDHSMDMSYTRAADIYVGDISSQVYEFLVEPRPCVFLNPAKLDWQNNPSFAHWHLGDVITTPEELMPAIRAAPARHKLYREKQAAMAAASLGDRSPGAASRAALATVAYLRR
jgi:hypothetical protein